jgi:hypothetical protein
MMNAESNKDSGLDASSGADERLASNDLAALIVDALLRPGIVKREDVDRAIAIAAEEINARKALGDY